MSIVGSKIGRIQIESVLGRGGMGTVYVGYDETLQRQVALKSIRARHRLSDQAKARFLREARILSRLDHPGICKIHDYLEDEDRDFLVLELIRGRDLRAAIRDGLDPAQRLPIARQIAEVLTAAHREGVVHRDLKPENVMLTESGEVKVLDFGLARPLLPEGAQTSRGEDLSSPALESPAEAADDDESAETLIGGPASAGSGTEPQTRQGAIVGTLTYMSPEQARGDPVTTASDMYSFGLLLQTLFTGREPYPPEAGQDEVLGRALLANTVPVAGLGSDLTRLIEELKSLAPAARPTAVAAVDRLRWIAERPKRRMRWLAAAAALILLALGGLKYTLDLRRERAIAVAARDEADRRRGQAEDLISFMLGDLRRKLEPVGRLELLDDVGDKALEYFASLSEQELTDDELFRRSQALSQIGEVRIAQGELDDARASFDEALVLAADLVARDPANGDWLKGLGAVHFWIGYVDWLRGDLEAALGRYEEYLALSERLVALDPEALDSQQELAYAHTNLGAVYEARGELERALESIRLSNGIKRRLVAADPGDPDRQRSLANGLSWLARTLLSTGRVRESLAEHRAELEIRQRLARADPRNTDSSYLLSINHGYVGDLSLMAGEVEAALDHNRTARSLLQALVAHDPANVDWRRELAVGRLKSGEALLVAGRAREAGAELDAARRLLAELVESDRSNDDWRRELGNAHQQQAAVHLASGRPEAAVGAARQALAVLEGLEPDDLKARKIESRTHVVLGRALARSGQPREARAAWARALELLEPLGSAAREPPVLDTRARALFYLGRREEAEAVVASLTASGYGRPDLLALGRERGVRIETRDRETVPQPERSSI